MPFSILFYIALILLAGLLMGRAVKMVRLPNVTGYLLAGLLLGPSVLRILPAGFVHELELVSDMALALIAFTVGAEFKFTYLKKVGITPLIIALFEALAAMLVVAVVLFVLGFGFDLALLLGAIASATAPAATIMVVKQYRAKGPVTDTLLSVVALDDAVALISFGFAMAVVNTMHHPGEVSLLLSILKPFGEVVGSVVLGAALGLLIKLPLHFFKKTSNRLIIILGFAFLGSALASMLGLSPLLLCMCMGAAVINFCEEGSDLLDIVDSITPPIFLMFFVVSGAELNLAILPKIGVIGVAYVLARVVGKIGGASFGAIITKAPPTVRKYVGFTLVPQAGVAIGLSLLAAKALPEVGATIQAVVLCGTFIYELVGPVCTKLALKKANEIES
ncbi:MAG: cation:proton antiporter [Clostridiales bacterium]|nr:cation:proton antiporter [Clostridiales bacterium]